MRMIKYISKIVNFLFILITGLLFVLSLNKHCEADVNTFDKIKSITTHQPLVYICIAFFFLMGIIVFMLFIERKNEKYINTISLMCVTLTGILSIIWIYFNDTVPHSDQAIIFEEARKIAGYSTEPYEWSYMSSFSFMRLLVLFIALLIRLFGDSQMVFRWVNVLAVLMLSMGMQKLMGKSHKAVISMIVLFFYPITIYSCYIYGTLAAVSFQIWAFYYAILFIRRIKEGQKGIIRAGIGVTICIFLGVQMHMSALIGMVAIGIFVLINCKKVSWYKNVILVVIMIGFYLVVSIAINKVYDSITDSPQQDAVPISSKIYMGITAPETMPGGPGSQDGSYWRMFELNDYDAKKTSRYLWPIIGNVVREYITGERDSYFFLKKIEYQWLDPSLDAHRIILLNNPNEGEGMNSKGYEKFYYSSFRQIVFKFATAFMILVYGMACYSGICLFFDKNEEENCGGHFLIEIFVIGGFLFQLVAESISRYVFSYYVVLLLEAIYGIGRLVNIINNKLLNNKGC